jgi:hypothetical protein
MKRKSHHKNGRDQARAQPDLFASIGAAPLRTATVGAGNGSRLPTPANQPKPVRAPKPAPLVIVSRLVVYEPAHIVIAGKARSVVMPG